MTTNTLPSAAVYTARRQKLMASIPDDSVVVLFSGTPPHKSADAVYSHTIQRNFYYLTGMTAPEQVLLMVKRSGTVQETLYIQASDELREKWDGRRIRPDAAREISGVQTVSFTGSETDDLARQFTRLYIDKVYLDLSRVAWTHTSSPAQDFANKLRTKYPYLAIHSVHNTLATLRLMKDETEVALMKKAIDVTKEGIDSILTHLKPGVMEYELEAWFKLPLGLQGCRETAFETIVASGENGVILHYVENERQVQDGELVLLDLGASYKGYAADISRTFPANGVYTQRQRDVYNVVLEAELAVIQAVKPGVTWKHLNDLAKETLAAGLNRLGLNGEDISRYYYHSIGHSLGLDTHDVTSIDDQAPLQPGMVITIEPGLYIAEEKIGIRIEDDVLVTETGFEVLSSNIPKTVEEIESFMAGAKNK